MALDFWQLAWGFAAGIGLGALYFGGLWLTVSRISRSERPRLLLFASFTVRLGAVLTAFYVLLDQGWVVLIAAMAGFLTARHLWLAAKGKVRNQKSAKAFS
jgi:F1F0 ATPase subunit 2